jgi:hypothetical protein
MRGTVILLLVLLVVGYVGIQAGGMIKAKGDLEKRVQYHLDFVDESAMESVRQDVVRDAQKFGVTVRAEDIEIGYQDTERQTLPQKLVGPAVARYVNKLVSIRVRYRVRIAGFPVRQEIAAHKIKTVQVQAVQPSLDELEQTQ